MFICKRIIIRTITQTSLHYERKDHKRDLEWANEYFTNPQALVIATICIEYVVVGVK